MTESKITEKISWRKKHRMRMLKIAFVLIWPGFACAYIGGVNNTISLMMVALCLMGAASLLAILTKKKPVGA